MGLYIRSAEQPILELTQEYQGHDSSPCVEEATGSPVVHIWHGAGIASAEHPARYYRVLYQEIEDTHCDHCRSANVLVLALRWSVAPHSGDVYYDYEVRCQDCRYFTAFSYSEN